MWKPSGKVYSSVLLACYVTYKRFSSSIYIIFHNVSVSTNENHYSHQYNSVDHYWSYCGQTMRPFDPHTHICCKGYVRPLLGPWYLNKCCGTLNYNRQSHWCCEGKLRRNVLGRVTARPGCCGRKSYNPTTHRCCNGAVTSSNVPYYLPSSCCGRISFNPFKDTCCEGQVQLLEGGFRYTRCCAARTMDTRKAKCCGGKVRNTSDPQVDRCCGTLLFHTSYEKCCDWEKGIVESIWTDCPN